MRDLQVSLHGSCSAAKRQVVNQGKRPARFNDVTTVTVRDRNTGEVTSGTFFGDAPFGK